MNPQEQTTSESVVQPTTPQPTIPQPAMPAGELNSSLQPTASPVKKHKYLAIIITLVTVLCFGILIAIVTINASTGDNQYGGDTDAADNSFVEDIEKKSFDSLTKNDAMIFLRENASKSKGESLPRGFLPQELMLQKFETDLVLLPSYDDPSEILQTLFDGDRQLISFISFTDGFEKNDFSLDTDSSDYWTVLSVEPTKCSDTDSCPRGVAFNKKYLDYYNYYAGQGMSEYYKVKFNNFSQDFVKTALPILVFSGVESNGLKYASSVYGYTIEETNDKYTLILQSIGIQSKPEDYYAIMLGDINNISTPTAINLYEVKFVLDKQTGEVDYQTSESGGKTSIVKTFEVSEEEGEELKQIMLQEYNK